MKKAIAAVLLALCVSRTPWAGLYAHQRMSPQVVAARRVAMGYDIGDHFIEERRAANMSELQDNDRKALATLKAQFQKWNRYAVVDQPEEAELLVAIRTGRFSSAQFHQEGAPRLREPGIVLGAEFSTPDDMLVVYEANQGKSASVLWRERQRNGLSDASSILFQHFRAAVEASAKR